VGGNSLTSASLSKSRGVSLSASSAAVKSGATPSTASRRPKVADSNPFAEFFNNRDRSPWTATSSSRRRWGNVYHASKNVFLVVEHDRSRYRPHWRSLVEPACLPLTTDYLPPLADFMNFLENPHTIYSSPPYENSLRLLHELVMQRLKQGFQVVQNSSVQESTAVAAASCICPARMYTTRSRSSTTIALTSTG
jgi:hypothetical protein